MQQIEAVKLLWRVFDNPDLYFGFQRSCLNFAIARRNRNQRKMNETKKFIEFLLTPISDGEFFYKKKIYIKQIPVHVAFWFQDNYGS